MNYLAGSGLGGEHKTKRGRWFATESPKARCEEWVRCSWFAKLVHELREHATRRGVHLLRARVGVAKNGASSHVVVEDHDIDVSHTLLRTIELVHGFN